jgi:hypothetical protein
MRELETVSFPGVYFDPVWIDSSDREEPDSVVTIGVADIVGDVFRWDAEDHA